MDNKVLYSLRKGRAAVRIPHSGKVLCPFQHIKKNLSPRNPIFLVIGRKSIVLHAYLCIQGSDPGPTRTQGSRSGPEVSQKSGYGVRVLKIPVSNDTFTLKIAMAKILNFLTILRSLALPRALTFADWSMTP